ncbi:hypothetical protein QJQ45_027173 [Haematococcus lacustris]|nr:hypothetical protein QJQ45_027173 [Haematococcus lacustris]
MRSKYKFRTSRVSSAYSNPSEALPGQPPEAFRWLRPVYIEAKRSQVRSLMCSTSNNTRFHDRDVSAALNIRRCAVGPGPRPTELCPGQPGQEWVYLRDKALLPASARRSAPRALWRTLSSGSSRKQQQLSITSEMRIGVAANYRVEGSAEEGFTFSRTPVETHLPGRPAPHESFRSQARGFLRATFLPVGYPTAVGRGYMDCVVWQAITNFALSANQGVWVGKQLAEAAGKQAGRQDAVVHKGLTVVMPVERQQATAGNSTWQQREVPDGRRQQTAGDPSPLCPCALCDPSPLRMALLLYAAVLASTFLLYAVGLGAGAIPTAGALNWVLKDGLGQMGTLVFGKTIAHNFDIHSKSWYFLSMILLQLATLVEIITIMAPQWFLLLGSAANCLKGLAWMANGSTRSVFNLAFARDNNIADITAK